MIIRRLVCDNRLRGRQRPDSLLSLLRKQPRHPTRCKLGRECEAQWRAGALRDDDAAFDQCGYDAAGMAIARPKQFRNVAAWQFSPIQDGFQNATCLLWQEIGADFLLDPQQYALPQPVQPTSPPD